MTYIRNPSAIHKSLKVSESEAMIALRPLEIHIPVRFTECGLATIGLDTTTYGAFALVDEVGNYGVVNICGMFKLNPSRTTKTTIDEKDYYVLGFEQGDMVFRNINIVKTAKFLFDVMDEFLFRADVPWYFSYDDRSKIFDTAVEFAGSAVGESLEIIELFNSITARNPKDLTKYYRTLTNDKNRPLPANVGLKSVQYSATNTTNKLSGAYFSQGVVAALVTKTERTEKMEALLRA